jgi:hypothetical protein
VGWGEKESLLGMFVQRGWMLGFIHSHTSKTLIPTPYTLNPASYTVKGMVGCLI